MQPGRVRSPGRKGWPHKGAWFSLGSWGTIINLVAILYGGVMLVNFALWRSEMFGAFGSATYNLADGTPFALRDLTNPFINEYVSIGGKVLSGLPAIPIFEATLGLILVAGAAYYSWPSSAAGFGQGRRRISRRAKR